MTLRDGIYSDPPRTGTGECEGEGCERLVKWCEDDVDHPDETPLLCSDCWKNNVPDWYWPKDSDAPEEEQ